MPPSPEQLSARRPGIPIPFLTTPRLHLRRMTAADLDDMAALLGDPAVMRHYPRPKTRAEAADWIRWNERLYADRGFGLWLMTLRATGEFAGDCGLTPQPVDGREEIEVGYHVPASLQGRGYASEAAEACREFARRALRLPRLIAIVAPANLASRRVAEKIGLRPEKRSVVFGVEHIVYAGQP